MNNGLDNSSKVNIILTVHMSVIEEQLTILDTNNLELNEQLRIMNEKSSKKKGEAVVCR